jgi:hypothetical protein
MKTCLKTIVLSALSALVVFTGMTYSSCKPKPCHSIVCAYDGVCKDGECICATGYEGNQCEAITRDKFTGVWNVYEDGTLTNAVNGYPIEIADAFSIQDVAITNLYNYFPAGLKIKAHVSGDTLYIDRQPIFAHYVEGFGYINPNTNSEEQAQMIVRYYVQDSTTHSINDYGWDQGEPSIWYKDL